MQVIATRLEQWAEALFTFAKFLARKSSCPIEAPLCSHALLKGFELGLDCGGLVHWHVARLLPAGAAVRDATAIVIVAMLVPQNTLATESVKLVGEAQPDQRQIIGGGRRRDLGIDGPSQ